MYQYLFVFSGLVIFPLGPTKKEELSRDLLKTYPDWAKHFKLLDSVCEDLTILSFVLRVSFTILCGAFMVNDCCKVYGLDVTCRCGGQLERCGEFADEAIKSRRSLHGVAVGYAGFGWICERLTIGLPLNHCIFVPPACIALEKPRVWVICQTNTVPCWWEMTRVKMVKLQIRGLKGLKNTAGNHKNSDSPVMFK